MHRIISVFLLAVVALSAQPYTPFWSGYLPSNRSETAEAVAYARNGDIWVAGSSSADLEFSAPNEPFQSQPKGGIDIALSRYRLDAQGRPLLAYRTFIGGSGIERVRAMAVDPNGRVVIVGSTTSNDFPTAGNAFQTASGGATDGFVTIVDPTQGGAASLVLSSYVGGASLDEATAVTIDGTGAIVVAGFSNSETIAGLNGAQGANRGGYEAFLLRIDLGNSTPLRYLTFLGGNSTDVATALATAPDGTVWMTGYTASTDFPKTADATQTARSGPFDGFLAGFNLAAAGLDSLRYSTYLGALGSDAPTSLQADADGGLWILGHTTSVDFPATAGAHQNVLGGNTDGFLVRYQPGRPAGQAITYATLIGGWGFELPSSLAALGNGRFAITGYTMFGGLPTANLPLQGQPGSMFADSFLFVLNTRVAGLAALEYGTYLGGSLEDTGNSISAGPNGAIAIANGSRSTNFPVTDGSTAGGARGALSPVVSVFRPRPQP